VRLLLLADLHLGARLLDWGDHASARRTELRRAWTEAVELALDPARRIDGVLVGGDLFDRPDPEPEWVDLVKEGVERLVGAGKPTVLLPGTYDGLSHPGSVYRNLVLPVNTAVVTWTEPRRLDLKMGGEFLHLTTWAHGPGAAPFDPAEALRRGDGTGYHAALVHVSAAGSAAAGAPAGWLPELPAAAVESSRLDLVVAGGEHTYRETLLGKTLAVVPGAPVGLHPGDWGDRYFVMADLGPEGVQLVQELRDVSPVVEIRVDAADAGITDAASFAAHLAGKLSGAAMARVHLTGATELPLEDEDLARVLADLPAVVDLRNETVLAPDGEFLTRLREESTIRGLFARRLEAMRAEARSDEECRALDRALVLGLAEFRRLETAHVG
jgi:exonuclease SbcD